MQTEHTHFHIDFQEENKPLQSNNYLCKTSNDEAHFYFNPQNKFTGFSYTK